MQEKVTKSKKKIVYMVEIQDSFDVFSNLKAVSKKYPVSYRTLLRYFSKKTGQYNKNGLKITTKTVES